VSGDEQSNAAVTPLAERLAALSKLESEMLRKAAPRLAVGGEIYKGHFYAAGILKRTLSQSSAFRMLIEAKNFQSAAGLLRMQIDSAMRMHALALVSDAQVFLDAWLAGEPINKLKAADGEQLRDHYLLKKLAEDHPWVKDVYHETSGFIHFSGKHFFTSIAHMDDATHILKFQITATDPDKPDEEYFEIVDAFFKATKLTAMFVIAYLYMLAGEEL
jgi:hypothetical protein